MASFHKKLEDLLGAAMEEGIVDGSARDAIISLSQARERKKGLLSLSSVLGGLGGFAVMLGVILVISSNWQQISDWMKISGFLLLLVGAHASALFMRSRGSDKHKTMDSLHFLGAGLFLAGIGLIAQIYQLSSDSGMAYGLWFVAILPLALLLRSASITLMSLVAFMLFIYINGHYEASIFRFPTPDSFTAALVFNMALAIGLVSFAIFARDKEHSMMRHLLIPGGFILFFVLYITGFYNEAYQWSGSTVTGGSYVYPAVAILFGLGGIGYGFMNMQKERYFQFLVVLSGVLGLSVIMLFLSMEKMSYTAGVAIALISWVLWFWLSFLCISYGSFQQQKGLVNIGVAGIGLGVMTRFFDLIGSMLGTGTVFILGGVVLLTLGWALEKWRRSIIARWERSSHAV